MARWPTASGRDGSAVGLPEPRAWAGPPRQPLWALCIGWFFVVGTVVVCIHGLIHGAGVVVVPIALLGWFFAVLTVYSQWLRRWRHRRGAPAWSAGGGGLEFRNGRVGWVVLHAGAWFCVVAGAWATWAGWHGWADLPMSGDERAWLAWIGPALLLLGVVFVLAAATGRLRRGIVQCTSEGVVQRSAIRTRSLTWDEIDGIVPGRERGAPVVRVVPRPGVAKSLMIEVELLEGDPAVFAHAVAWFAEHPEHRDELTDGRALVRVMEGRADMTSAAEAPRWSEVAW